MNVDRLEPFGGEVVGIDLFDATRDLAREVRKQTAVHKVLVLRGQHCTARQFAEFLAAMGKPMFTPGETPVEGAQTLNIVTNVGRTRPPRSVFHTDTSYVEAPPAITGLMAVELPTTGGETLFTDQVRALQTLPPPMRARIEGRRALHAGSARDETKEGHRHPLALVNAESGEEALYITTPERCTHIDGEGEEEGRSMIEKLYEHSIRPDHLYRHTWREGDVVLWDNRSSMHRADHSAVKGNRTFYRGMVR